MDDILKTIRISSAGMRVQGTRLRVIAQNIANSESLPQKPGENPYRRKLVTFRNELDKSIGLETVRVHRLHKDLSDFGKRYDPSHPAADKDGYVATPNVNTMLEMMDMREAQRSYEANLNLIRSSKTMLNGVIDVLRAN
ncbi:MAG: flagellar basal body rod protein FlgC [Rhodospirillaceae bacterium]